MGQRGTIRNKVTGATLNGEFKSTATQGFTFMIDGTSACNGFLSYDWDFTPEIRDGYYASWGEVYRVKGEGVLRTADTGLSALPQWIRSHVTPSEVAENGKFLCSLDGGVG